MARPPAGARARADLARAEIGRDHGGVGGDLARGSPSAILAPSSITTTRSESCITRSSLCSISRMVKPALQGADDLEHLGGLGRVHAGGRLVEQQQARLERQRARDLEAAAVGVGEAEGRIVDARHQPLAEQREDLHRVGAQLLPPRPSPRRAAPARARARRAARSPAMAGAPPQAACARRPARCRARSGCRTRGRAGTCARGRARASCSAGRPVMSRPANVTRAGVRRVEPGDEVEHRGLAGAVRADDADELALVRRRATARRRR